MKTIEGIAAAQRAYFAAGKTLGLDFRLEQLRKLKMAVTMHEVDLLLALKADLNKPRFEAYGTEIGLFLDEADYLIKHLKNYMKPELVRTSLVNFPSISSIRREPYGITLVISPWNYPVLLSLEPLIGALAAGNCVVLKPSNYSPHVSKVLKEMLGEIFPDEYVAVVEGGREENQLLLEEKFDYIFFTGSVKVGNLVMESASRNLTPISLELGGKSPCIVDETANLKLAAKRIVWGKYLNAGQTCVAPDYLLVHETVKTKLLEYMKYYINKRYNCKETDLQEYPRIVNQKHFIRLMGLMSSGKLVIGGKGYPRQLQIIPTILDEVNWSSPIMQEEIFGPILPVLTFKNLKEAFAMVQARPKPLSAYFFTKDRRREAYFLKHVSFGGGCINDTVMHLASSLMPFGGVGDSGMGGYHGKSSFETFSHTKSILKKSGVIDMPFRYPPYKELYYKIMKQILK